MSAEEDARVRAGDLAAVAMVRFALDRDVDSVNALGESMGEDLTALVMGLVRMITSFVHSGLVDERVFYAALDQWRAAAVADGTDRSDDA